MKIRNLLAVGLLLLSLIGSAMAQNGDKVGFVNLNAVLSRMPEYNAVLKSLQIREKKYAERLQVEKQYLDTKVQDYVEAKQNGATEADLKTRENELLRLEKEVKASAAKADEQLARKQMELIKPVMDKLQATIDQIAKAQGYTYVLNSVDGAAVSIVLNAPEDHDLTKAVMDALGIDYSNN
ncbi:MAG: OmpH family outer membrane protein [Bacteroidia bacterium]